MAAGISLTSKEFQLQEAAREGRIEEVKVLLAEGIPPDCPTLSTPPLSTAISTIASPRGSTGLEGRMVEVITILLRANADPNLSARGVCPLHRAMKIRNVVNAERVVRLLLDHRADPAQKNATGQTAEEIAIHPGIRILLLRREVEMLRRQSRDSQGVEKKKSKFCSIV